MLMNYNKYDYPFLEEVATIIERIDGGDPKELMEKSSFYELYVEDINFVQHYSPPYWAEFVIEECQNIDRLALA